MGERRVNSMSILIPESKPSAVAALFARASAGDYLFRPHALQVAVLSVRIGQALGLAPRELETLELAARLHDVGKLAVPRSILAKAGPLDDEEWAAVRRHPAEGARLLAPFVPSDRPARDHPQPSRALGRRGLPGRAPRGANPARGAHRRHGRRVLRDDRAATVPADPRRGCGTLGALRASRAAVRPCLRGARAPADLRGVSRAARYPLEPPGPVCVWFLSPYPLPGLLLAVAGCWTGGGGATGWVTGATGTAAAGALGAGVGAGAEAGGVTTGGVTLGGSGVVTGFAGVGVAGGTDVWAGVTFAIGLPGSRRPSSRSSPRPSGRGGPPAARLLRPRRSAARR